MGYLGWVLKQYWFRYPDANYITACYSCARGTNTYINATRRERFVAHNGVQLLRPPESYIMPLCSACLKRFGVHLDEPPSADKPVTEETPKLNRAFELQEPDFNFP